MDVQNFSLGGKQISVDSLDYEQLDLLKKMQFCKNKVIQLETQITDLEEKESILSEEFSADLIALYL